MSFFEPAHRNLLGVGFTCTANALRSPSLGRFLAGALSAAAMANLTIIERRADPDIRFQFIAFNLPTGGSASSLGSQKAVFKIGHLQEAV